MKLGVLTVPLQEFSTAEAFAYLHELGVQSVELGTGGYTNRNHLNPEEYLDNPAKLAEFRALLQKNELTISALSCHGNPVHPDKATAAGYHQVFADTCRLAQQLEVDTVVAFSGCPGDSESSLRPNWVPCAWPEDFRETLAWQWDEVLIPYWRDAAALAASYGVKYIALEMHPGFCVYNPATMLRLREAVEAASAVDGVARAAVGANFDPSHLIWQQMDPCAALQELQGAVYHFHAKDTRVDQYNTAKNGVLDTGSYGGLAQRSWVFRTVGWGTSEAAWRDMMSTLRLIGYDGAVSIEHEDGLMSVKEGLEKAVAFLKPLVLQEQVGESWWV